MVMEGMSGILLLSWYNILKILLAIREVNDTCRN
jgi:hypothetical protein